MIKDKASDVVHKVEDMASQAWEKIAGSSDSKADSKDRK